MLAWNAPSGGLALRKASGPEGYDFHPACTIDVAEQFSLPRRSRPPRAFFTGLPRIPLRLMVAARVQRWYSGPYRVIFSGSVDLSLAEYFKNESGDQTGHRVVLK